MEQKNAAVRSTQHQGGLLLDMPAPSGVVYANSLSNIKPMPAQYFKKINVKSEGNLMQECFKNQNGVNTLMATNPISLASSARHMEISLADSFSEKFNSVLQNFSNDEMDIKYVMRNTDHDLYSKPLPTDCEKVELDMNANIPFYQLNYFTDVRENTEDFMIVETISQQQQHQPLAQNSLPFVAASLPNAQTFEIKTEDSNTLDNNANILHSSALSQNGVGMVESSTTDLPSTSTDRNLTSSSSQAQAESTGSSQSRSASKKLSERDKYYRHKRHFNRRMEKRFDALLQVVGQIAKTEYPNINLPPLLISSASSIVAGTTKLFSSDSEQESGMSSDLENDNKRK